MRRRSFLAAAAAAGLAGCLSSDSDGDGGGDGGPDTTGTGDGTTETTDGMDGETTTTGTAETTTRTPDPYQGTLTVATYQPFVDAPSSSPGEWVKTEFEKEFPDATLEWFTPENELNYFIQRRANDVTIDADVYVGLNVDDLIRVDEALGDRAPLRPVDRSELDNVDHLRTELEFDPQDRALPFDTGYISLVYDESEVESPETFEALTTDEYEGTLLAQNAQTSDPGRAFMLWTIHEYGPDGYIDYWRDLVDNDVRILGSWNDAYGAYGEGERPIVVSYSTDQVYANRYDQDMTRHQVGFLEDQGYANPEGMAVFDSTDVPELATAFLDFMLSQKVQSEIPLLNVQFPATDHAELNEEFRQFAYEPPEPVTYSYDELQGNLNGWIDRWAREIASN